MADKKQLHVIVAGEANTGKTTVGNLLVKAFREMGFLAEFQGEALIEEEDLEKRLTGLVGVVEKVVIREVQIPRGSTGEELPNLMRIIGEDNIRLKTENEKLRAMMEGLDQAIKEGKITAPGFVPSPVLQAQGVPLCPHARPAGEMCPHCLGISGGLEVRDPPKLSCPKCLTEVDMLVNGLCRRCAGMVTG